MDMYNGEEPFWDRTLRLIREIWPLGDPEELRDRLHADLPDSDLNVLRRAIGACLEGRGGEVSARRRAAELGRAYMVLSEKGRRKFLYLLAREYDVDNVAVEKAIEERGLITSPGDLQAANQRLRGLLESPRSKLLREFNELHEGVKFLVDLRAELMALARNDRELAELDRDVHRLLVSWFDIGFLDLRRITWDTPASILEKLIAFEAVHAISSWEDLKNRLRSDRRCYAYFHPRMPNEPLIFVEIALVNGIAANVLELLDVEAPVKDPEKADTAIFYSISNCQKGLAGVSFGNFLIKRVVTDLAAKHPNLKTFATLSPVPGFLNWLLKNLDDLALGPKEKEAMAAISAAENRLAALQEILLESRKGGNGSLEQVLLGLCARYLMEVKRGRQAQDRVAHFHLSNGAQIERINWGANLAPAGIEQSAGIMVNYIYKLSQIERNHELYSERGEISASSNVRKLIKAFA